MALLASLLVLIVASPAFADDCGLIGGVVAPNGECRIQSVQTLTGGTFNIARSLHITPTGGIVVSPSLIPLTPSSLTLNITGDFTIDTPAGTGVAISGDGGGLTPVGATISIAATGNVFLDGDSSGAVGGSIQSNGGATCVGTARAGKITLTSSRGNITLKLGANLTATGGCLGGEIVLTAVAGDIDMGGEILSKGGDNPLTTAVRGGPITLAAANRLWVRPGAAISSEGSPSGTLAAPLNYGADRVHLESGGDMVIEGVAQSVGGFNFGTDVLGGTNRCTGASRAGKPSTPTACVELWVGGTLTARGGDPADLSSAVNGYISARSGKAGRTNGTCCTWIDIFVNGNILLVGQPSAVGTNAFMIDAQQASTGAKGGTITMLSLKGKITASGRTFIADGAVGAGGTGGTVIVEASGPTVYPPTGFHPADPASNIDLGDSIQFARGANTGLVGGAGVIHFRSYNGQITGGPPEHVTAQGRGGCKDRVTGVPLIDPSTGQPYPCIQFAGTINAGGIGVTELIVTLCDGWLYNGVTVPLAVTSAPTCGGTPTPPPDVVIPKKPTITIFGGTYVYDALERPATGDQTNGAFTMSGAQRVAVVPPKAFGAGGTAEPLLPLPTVTYVDANNQPVTVPIAVGTYTATAYYPGNATYSPLITSAPITILSQARPTPLVTVTGGIFRYDGQPHPATGVTTRDASTSAAITTPATVVYYNCTFNPAAGWNPATDASCTTTPPVSTTTTKIFPNVTLADGIPVLAYFPGNNMYGPARAETRIAIWAPRPSVTTTTGFSVPYDGLPHPSTPTTRDATDNVTFPVNFTDIGPTVVTYTFSGVPSGVPVNVGTYPVQAVYPGDNRHSGSTGTNTIIITPVTATMAVTAASAACDSQAHGATGTVRSASGALLGTPLFTYTDSAGHVLPGPPTASGVYTVLATLPPLLAQNYSVNPSTVTTTLTIAIQTVTIAATGGTFTFDGRAHPASATMTGTGLPAGTQPVITYTRNGVATGTPTDVGVYTATASLPSSVGTCFTATPATTTITITAAPAPAPEEACLVVDLREITYFKNSSVITSSDSSVRSKNGLSGGFKPSLWPYSATGGYNTTGSRGTLFRIYGFKASEVGVGIRDLDVPGKTYPVKEDTQIPGPGRFYIELNEPGGSVGGHPARVFICPSQLQKNVIDQNVCKTSTGGGDDKDGKDGDGKDSGKDGSGKDARYARTYGDDGKDGKDSGSGDDGKDGKDGGSDDDNSCSSDGGKDGKDGKDDDGKDSGKDGSGKDARYARTYGDDDKDGKDSGGGDDGKDGGCTSCTQDDGVFTNSSVLTAAEKNVPGIMLTHNASALTVPQRVRTELSQLGMPLQSPPGTPATRAAVDYIAVQHWGGGNATYREFVDVRVTFIDDSQTDRRQHYAAGLHTAANLDAASATAFGCDYLDADPTNDTIRLNDNWDGTHVGDPNWGPACGTREPSQNQKKRETADVMYNTAQLLTSVNTDSDTVRLFFGELRALPAASAASSSSAFTTYTQGGWGASPNGNNPGALLAAKFATVYPGGSVNIGGTRRLTFTSAGAIASFLPQGGTPSVLTASATNATSSSAGVFAGQVLALRLSVDFSTAGVTKVGLASKKVASGKLAGSTVAQVLALANAVIGGSTASLPAGVSVSDLNAIVDAINNNYDNGTTNKGYLQ